MEMGSSQSLYIEENESISAQAFGVTHDCTLSTLRISCPYALSTKGYFGCTTVHHLQCTHDLE